MLCYERTVACATGDFFFLLFVFFFVLFYLEGVKYSFINRLVIFEFFLSCLRQAKVLEEKNY